MKSFRTAAGASAALLAVLVAAPLRAQQAPPAATPPDSAELARFQALAGEFQRLQQRLQAAQVEALEADSTLQARQIEIQEMVQEAARTADPELDAKVERLQALRLDAQSAQQTADTARLMEIFQEGQMLQMEVQQAQRQAASQPAIQAEIEAFQDSMEARMEEVDPEIPGVLARLRTLADTLQAMQEAAGS